MNVTQLTDLIRQGSGRICFVATFGCFAAVYPETLCKMFFLLGVGFFVATLLLGFAGEIISLLVHCVVVVWQGFCALLAAFLLGWRAVVGGRGI